MKALLLLTLLATAAAAVAGGQAQSFHVTGIQDHMRTRDERGTGHTRLYTGKIDGLVVVAEEGVTAFSSASHLTIGKDYTVSKFKPTPGGPLHVQQDPDKKGRQSDAWLTVISVTVTEP